MNGATTSVPDRYYSFVLTHDLALLRGEVLCAAPIRAIIRSVGQLSGQDVFFPSVHESRSGHYPIEIVAIRLRRHYTKSLLQPVCFRFAVSSFLLQIPIVQRRCILFEASSAVLGDNRLGHFRAEKGNLLLWNTFMPIFGMKNPRGTFVAIIKGMAFECGIKVEVKKGIYEIFPHFEISKRGGAYDDIVVDFYELEHGDDYCAMARKYRQYQLERGEVKPLRERAKGNPNLAYTAESIFVRAKLAIKDLKNRVPHQTPENEPKLHVYYTYDKFAELMRNLKKLGVEKAEMCMVGWQAGGFDGRYPQYFPVPEELGGV